MTPRLTPPAASFHRGTTLALAMASGHNNFGVLRLLLALAVVVSHAFSVKTGLVADEPLARLTGFTLGEHAVNGFFAVSGFLVTMSYDRRGWRDYVVARSLRIVPALVVAVLAVALLLGPILTTRGLGAYMADDALWRFIATTLTSLKSTLALPGVFEGNAFRFPLGTVWTLKYEILCYAGVVVAGLAGLFRARGLVLALLAALTLAAITREFMAPDGAKGLETALRLPLIFLAGGTAWLWRERLPLSLSLLAAVSLGVLVLAATPVFKPALYLATTYGVLALALHPKLTGILPEPGADLSYGIYLYGWPVQQALVAVWPGMGAVTLLAPSLIVTVFVAFASWHLVEKPALALKQHLLRAHPRGTARYRPT